MQYTRTVIYSISVVSLPDVEMQRLVEKDAKKRIRSPKESSTCIQNSEESNQDIGYNYYKPKLVQNCINGVYVTNLSGIDDLIAGLE